MPVRSGKFVEEPVDKFRSDAHASGRGREEGDAVAFLHGPHLRKPASDEFGCGGPGGSTGDGGDLLHRGEHVGVKIEGRAHH